MKRQRFVAAFLIGLAAPGTAGADTPARFLGVRDHVARQVEAGRAASVAVAVVEADRVSWAEGFGVADPRAGTPATPDSIYRLASVSKPITATGLMVLVDHGRIDLDAPANRYLAGSPLVARLGSADAMTVRRLANHSSGLPTHYNFFYDGQRPPAMDDTIRRYGFAADEPGRSWEYSNLGFGILGHLTGSVAGVPWREFMEKEVYDPLGMARTSDRIRPGREADAAAPRTRDASGRFVPVGDYDTDHPGASAVWSSAHDMARFARMHLRRGELDGVRLLSRDAARAMQERTAGRDAGSGMGVGWGVSTERGRRCVSHAGGMPGVSTMLRLFPDDGIALVVLLNSDVPDVLAGISDRLTAAVLPVEKPGPEKSEKAAVDKAPPDPSGWKGTWVGKLSHPDGEIPLTLDVEAPDSARLTCGTSPAAKLRNVEIRDGRLHAELDGALPTRPDYHGPATLAFRLDCRGDRLTGVAAVVGPNYFSLPHWVDLSRDTGKPPTE